jgi:hypothetical protein
MKDLSTTALGYFVLHVAIIAVFILLHKSWVCKCAMFAGGVYVQKIIQRVVMRALRRGRER